MPDLDELLYQLRTRNSDVVHARNEGIGSVPIHYVDDLTTAVAALLARIDEAENAQQTIAFLPSLARVGDLIGPNHTAIPDNVLEFVNEEGDTWRRPGDQAEATHEGQVYDWVTEGGWATTEGQLDDYTPLRVTKVRNDDA